MMVTLFLIVMLQVVFDVKETLLSGTIVKHSFYLGNGKICRLDIAE